MRSKHTSKPLRGNISKVRPQELGGLRMRAVGTEKALKVTFLHEELPPFSEAPTVVHAATAEFVFMLRGEIRGVIGGENVLLKKGDYLLIPPGVKHKFTAGRLGGAAISIFSPPMDKASPDAKVVFDGKTGS